MLQVLFPSFTVNKNIIKKDKKKPSKMIAKYSIHALEASHSTTKGLEKSGNASMGQLLITYFIFLEGIFSLFIPLESILLSQIIEWRSQIGEPFHKIPVVCTYSNEAS